MIIGNAISPFALRAGEHVFDALSLDYFTRAGITDATEKLAVDAFVRSCRANSAIWASLQGGAVWLVSPTSIGASMYNLMSSDFTLSAGNAPNYSTSGWSFLTASAHYLKTGFTPSTHMTINTGGVDFYVQGQAAASTFCYGSVITGGGSSWAFGIKNLTDKFTAQVYTNLAGTFNNSNSSPGTYSFDIRSNTDKEVVRNGTSLGTIAVASAGGLPAFECYIGCRNVNGSPLNHEQINLGTVIQRTTGLSFANTVILQGFINTYNANVISGGR